MSNYFDTTPLEFAAIKQMLVDLAYLPMTKDLARDLAVRHDADEIKGLQAQTAEALALVNNGTVLRIGTNKDPEPSLKHLGLGGDLTGAELIDLAYLLSAACDTRHLVGDQKAIAPELARIANTIPKLEPLVKNIRSAIAENGDVKDSASRLLAQLRRQAATTYSNLIGRISKLMENRHFRAYLQSDSIANRNNRLCLEVKSEHRSKVPGITHGVSATGATVFLEPLSLVRICNDWRELEAQAQSEERRILNTISAGVAMRLLEVADAVDALTLLDLCFAKGKLATQMNAVRPRIATTSRDAFCDLKDARHPLLGDEAVASDIKLGPNFRGLVITGPNAGGKTVTLKTVGLLVLMHQAGLHIPVGAGSALKLFDNVFACIGDGQNIANFVSTFSAHIAILKNIVEQAGKGSLVLLDELCSNTEPQEGAAMACAVLNHLVAQRAVVVATTHYVRVAEFAAQSQQLENASVELEMQTLRPTYRLRVGLPGRSYALELAHNMGLDADIIASTRQLLGEQHDQIDNILGDIKDHLRASETTKKRTEQTHKEAEQLHAQAEQKLADIDSHIQYLVERARRDLQREIAKVERELTSVKRTASKDADLDAAKRALNRLRGTVSEPTWFPITSRTNTISRKKLKRKTTAVDLAKLRQGDTVVVENLNKSGQVVAIKSSGKVEVQVGNARVSVASDKLHFVKTPPKSSTTPK